MFKYTLDWIVHFNVALIGRLYCYTIYLEVYSAVRSITYYQDFYEQTKTILFHNKVYTFDWTDRILGLNITLFFN